MMEIKAFSVYWWPHAEISLTFTWGKSGLQRIRRFRHRHGKIHLTSSAFMVSRERKSLSGTVAVAVWPFSLRGLLHWLPLCRLGHCVNQSFFKKNDSETWANFFHSPVLLEQTLQLQSDTMTWRDRSRSASWRGRLQISERVTTWQGSHSSLATWWVPTLAKFKILKKKFKN